MSNQNERLSALASVAEGMAAELRHLAGVPEPEDPEARFTYEVDGLTVSVDSSSSTRADDDRLTVWDFGDGTIRSGEVIDSHTYRQPGTYRVALEIEGPVLTRVTHEVTVAAQPELPEEPGPEVPPVEPEPEEPPPDVEPEAPPVEPEVPPTEPAPEEPPTAPEDPNAILVARFTHAVDGLTVNVDRTGSKRPDGGGESRWDFGDGTVRLGKAVDSHTYKAPGTYPITLELNAFRHEGLTSRATHSVTVAGDLELPPVDPKLPPEPELPPDPDPTPPTLPPPAPHPSGRPVSKLPEKLRRAFDGYPDSAFTVRVVRDANNKIIDPNSSDPAEAKLARNKLLRANGWDSYEVDTPGRVSILAADPFEGRPCVRFFFPAGHQTGTGAGIVQSLPSLPLRLTHSVLDFEMVLEKWQGNGSGTNKIGFTAQGVNGNNQLFLDAHGSGDNPLALTFALQGVTHAELGYAPRPPGSSGTARELMTGRNPDGSRRFFEAYPPKVQSVLDVEWDTHDNPTIPRDRWNRIQWEIQHNTPGQADGTVWMYLNGRHVVTIRKIDLTRNGASFLSGIHWRPILGGGGASNTRDMSLLFRNMILSGT